MTVANTMTVVRLLMAIIAFGLMLLDSWLIAAVILLIAVLMDTLDGILARKLGEVTTAGVFLDVMADKIVIISTYIVLGYKLNIAWLLLGLLMLFREYTIDTMRSIAASKNQVISADKFSKIKGVLFMFAMLVMLFNVALLGNNSDLAVGLIILASIGMILSYITLVRFYFKYIQKLL